MRGVQRVTLLLLLLAAGCLFLAAQTVALPAELRVRAINSAGDALKFLPGEPVNIEATLSDLEPGDEEQAFVRIYHPTEAVEISPTSAGRGVWRAEGEPLEAGARSEFIVQAYIGETARRLNELNHVRELLLGNRTMLRMELPEKSAAVARLTRMIARIAEQIAALTRAPSIVRRLDVAAIPDAGLKFWSGASLLLASITSTTQEELIGRSTGVPAVIKVHVRDSATGHSVAGVPLVHELISGEGRFESASGLSWTSNRAGIAGAAFVPLSAAAKIRISVPGDPETAIIYTVKGKEARLTWFAPEVALAQPWRSAVALLALVADHKGDPIVNETVKFRIVDAAGKPVPAPERVAVFMTPESTTSKQDLPSLGKKSVAGTTLVILDSAPLGKFYVQAYLPHLPTVDPTLPVAIERPIIVLAFDSQDEMVLSGQGQRARGGHSTVAPLVARFIGKPDVDPFGAKIWPLMTFTIAPGTGHLSREPVSALPASPRSYIEIQLEEKRIEASVFYAPASPHHHPAMVEVKIKRKLPPPPMVVNPGEDRLGFVTAGTVWFTTRPADASLVRPVFKRDRFGRYQRHEQTGQPVEEREVTEPIGQPASVYQVDVLDSAGNPVEPDHKGKVMVELRVPRNGPQPAPESALVRSLDHAHREVPDGIGAAPVRISLRVAFVRNEGDSAVYRSEPFVVTGDLLGNSVVEETPEQKYQVIYAPHEGFIQVGHAASPEKWEEKWQVVARIVILLAIDGLGQPGWKRFLHNSEAGSRDSPLGGWFGPSYASFRSSHNEAVFPTVTFLNWAGIFTGGQPKEIGVAGNEYILRNGKRYKGKGGPESWRHVNFTGGALLKPQKRKLVKNDPTSGYWALLWSNHGGLQRPDSETPLIVSLPGIDDIRRPSQKPRAALLKQLQLLLAGKTSNPDVAQVVRVMQRLVK